MVTSLPTPSAPRAALVKLVAMEKKYTVPVSLVHRMLVISVSGMFTLLMVMSQSCPSVISSIFSRTGTGTVASAVKI